MSEFNEDDLIVMALILDEKENLKKENGLYGYIIYGKKSTRRGVFKFI